MKNKWGKIGHRARGKKKEKKRKERNGVTLSHARKKKEREEARASGGQRNQEKEAAATAVLGRRSRAAGEARNRRRKEKEGLRQRRQGDRLRVVDGDRSSSTQEGEGAGERVEATAQVGRGRTGRTEKASSRIYFSPSKSSQSVDPIPAVHEHGLSVPSLPEHTDTKSCAINETAVIPSVPKHAMQAFMLLRESPAAQTVVASIASDRNVWDAVLQNEALRGYLNSETRNAEFEQPSKTSTVSSDNKGDGKSENPLMSFMEYVKNGVAEMVTKMTYFIHNLFGGSAGKGEAGAVDGFPAAAMTAGGSLMALAVMVIMVVVMKRG